jgi:cytochrome c
MNHNSGGRRSPLSLALLHCVGGILALSQEPPAAAEQAGAKEFEKYCSVCHSVEEDENKLGPSLAGVVGRKAGSVPDFNYTSENQTSGIIWTPDILDKYIEDPQKVVPGTAMTFPGLKDAAARKLIILYLKAHSK